MPSTLSDTLGKLSIGAWLFAQSPQIYENYKRRLSSLCSVLRVCQLTARPADSTDGLSLAFLGVRERVTWVMRRS
jgi:hypothetical protein